MLRVGAALPGATRVVLMTLRLKPILIIPEIGGPHPTGINALADVQVHFPVPPFNPLGLDQRTKIIAEI